MAGFFSDPPLLGLVLVLLGAFMVTRLPYFWYNDSVRLSQDSGSYMDVVKTLQEGHWPRFIFRTPGYPLFVWMISWVTPRWMAVICVQNLLSFLACVALVAAVRRYRAPLAFAATVALCGYLGSTQVLLYDVSLLSDSLYTVLLILTAAALFAALAKKTPLGFAVLSAAMVAAILVRPAGMYLIVIYALVLAYLAWDRRSRACLLGFALPLPAMLLAFCAYNYATIAQFVISPFGEANLAGATALFWEPDPSLPAPVNRALEALPASYTEVGITQAELDTVRTSWDPDPLFDIYAKAYNRLVWSAGWGSGSRFGSGTYLQSRGYIKQVSLVAIRRHPSLYAKYVWVNMVMFFRGVGYRFDVRTAVAYREAGAAGPAVSAPVGPGTPAAAPFAERCVEAAQSGWQRLHGVLFQQTAWSWACGCVLLASAVRLLACRGRDEGAFILLALTLMPLGASLVVCLVETATDRYSYPTQFIYYLSVALLPLLATGAARRTPDPCAA